MMLPTWTTDDGRILGDVIAGTLAASAIRLVIVKAFIEPLAVWVGQKGYRQLDRAVGDRLPDWFEDT